MFRFKLEFLLRHRRQKEEEAMYDLAQRIRDANQIEVELADIQERRATMAAEIKSKTAGGIPAMAFAMYKDYQEFLRRKDLATRNRLQLAETLIEKQRVKLVEASVARKVIERYREKQKETYEKATANREQNSLEEQAALVRTRRENEDQVKN